MSAPAGSQAIGAIAPAGTTQGGAAPRQARQARPYIVAGLVILLTVFGGLGAWAALASLSGAVIAQGVVTVDSNQKTVQHLEGGIVAEIFVRDGDRVEAGDLLVRLDDTRAGANLTIIEGQLNLLRAREARLLAEREGREALHFPDLLMDQAGDPAVTELLGGELELFAARRAALTGEIAILKKRISQLRQEVAGLQTQFDAKGRQIDLIGQELTGLRLLHAKGYAPKTRILALEREGERLAGERGQHLADRARAEGGIGEAKLQIIQLEKTFREEVLAELGQVQGEVFDLAQRRVAAADDLNRIDIRAPLAGQVMGLQVHTRGGVVSPGQPLLHIVPEGDRLVIEAQVLPQDIDKVGLGLTAVVRLSAFNMRSTPELTGEVIGVSPDRFVEETTGQPYYKARISFPAEELAKLTDLDLVLLPGMPAEVFINTGDRQALSYFMKPLTDSLTRAFRDE